MIYAWLRWLNRTGKQTAWRFMLWRWRAAHEDRTKLKQEVRKLQAEREPQ